MSNENWGQRPTNAMGHGVCGAILSLGFPNVGSAPVGPLCTVVAGHAGSHQAYYGDRLREWSGEPKIL